jgi:hypothetical protein
MIRGSYQDTLRDAHGRRVSVSGWWSNTIVNSTWPLVAGLLKNDPDLGGILFWAVGAGDPAWDTTNPSAGPKATRLVDEVDRQAVGSENIVYLNPDGSPTAGPTGCIEVSVVFNWSADRVLREFGLFGGNASTTADSGYLINYVVHARIDMTAGGSLARRLRLTLRPDVGPDWQAVPTHWLGSVAVVHIDGIGSTYAATLQEEQVGTIEDLATMETSALQRALPLMKLVELRAKARMALRTVAGIQPLAGLNDRTAWNILMTAPETLVNDSGASTEQVNCLREQMSALQLTLDNRYLQQVKLGELTLSR